jgi:hypothetical protein
MDQSCKLRRGKKWFRYGAPDKRLSVLFSGYKKGGEAREVCHRNHQY